ncbi:MAG: TetR/AcrR family transcriptional regulator [Geodermatophilaceae bacterium]|nr:TetR/AcrR family transcriptional regulator [Geodermatophilaceae bacterium]
MGKTTAPTAHGRGLSEARTPEILQAALAVLAEVGYDRLTMEAVAARAHAGKATLYRRWASKAELVVEAVTVMKTECMPPLSDTGSLREDLHRVAALVTTRLSQDEMCVMRGLASALAHDRELATVFEREFIGQRRADMAELLRRAQRRGEIPPDRDIEILAHILPSMVFARSLVTSKQVDLPFLKRLIDEVLIPAATAPAPPAAAHSKESHVSST